ncbi:MAG: MYG1 family protein [Candidatus Paceibacterota bacterium]|jgi:uncharacterized UPF0160 family protein
MKKITKIKRIVTHDGPFHSDDIFSCAVISLVLEKRGIKYKIIRTRSKDIVDSGDFVVDTGGIYNERKNIFDHHQKGGAGKRKNGIEYASFGLVWRKFGAEISGSAKTAMFIDNSLVSAIDADDNGISLYKNTHEVSPFIVPDLFKFLRPTWREPVADYSKNFLKAVKIAKEVLSRAIVHTGDEMLAEQIIIGCYKRAKNKKIIVLNKYYPFKKTFDKFSLTLFVIFPRENEKHWVIKTVNKKGESFISRKDFPKSWAGLQCEELQKVTGVKDALFCHKGRFLAAAKSKEGAIKLAQIAVES